MRFPLPLGPAVMLLLVAACGVPPEPTLAVERRAVVGGVPEPGYPAVGAILPVPPTCGEPAEASPITCTGTLIAPRVVLTAAHCVENADAPQVLSVVFSSEPSRALPSERVRTVAGWLHPDWSAGRNDIGVLLLAEDAPVAPVSLDGSALPADVVGRTTRVVGFGIDDQGRTGTRRSGTAQVTAVEAETFSLVASPGMSCGGDSGGPSFLEVDGVERLVGITSFGDTTCAIGTNMRVDVHEAFIQAVLDEVARAPPTRRPLDPTVDACTAGCQEHADCPLGMACVTRPEGGKSCAVAGLEAGRFGEVCTGPEGERPCVKAGEACRLWLPCSEPSEVGCAVSGGSAGKSGAGTFAALLALAAWLSSAGYTARRKEGTAPMTSRYQELHTRSIQDPEGFWGELAEDIHWEKRWDRVLDASHPPLYRWFTGGLLNTCYNALDRHVDAGQGGRTALIHDSPVTQTVQSFTYAELRDQVARFAGALAKLGVAKGDRVIIYMPMVPQAVVAMLACARLGAVHSVVFGGFAPHELATRINDATPKVVVSASCGIEAGRIVRYKPMLDSAIEQAHHKPQHCIILQRPQERAELKAGRDLDWDEAVAGAEPAACVPVAATDPLYILYTSGTTSQPKGIVRDNGGHAVALKWTMRALYDVQPGEVFWAASDVGWVVGHSYIVYGPLLHGCTTLLYEGKPVGTPDAGAFWRVISQHKVCTLFTAPTAFRAIKREDPGGERLKQYDLSSLRALFLAGERSDPDTLQWAESLLKVPVVDHWWQTETGWCISGNPLGLERFPIKYGSATRPMPGWDVRCVDPSGQEVAPGQIGSIVCKLPLPPGTLPTLWNAEERFVNTYMRSFPGHYQTGDAGYIDPDGYVFIMSRTDDIINVAGHRLSTGAMEEVLSSHPDVAECAVIGVHDELKGQVPLGFLVLKSGVKREPQAIIDEVVKKVREEIGPVAAFKQALVVPRLPKTRSGKILRGTMQKIADSQEFKTPATIEDEGTLEEIDSALRGVGYAKGRKD